MTTFTIAVQDQAVQALLQRMAERTKNLQPALQAVGDGIVERTKRRFETSTGPDGEKWTPNAPATLGILSARLGKSYRKKGGDLNAAGERRLAGNKPLIGESGDLRRQIVAQATANQVTVGVGPKYAAIHQFGGKAGRGLKVEIPARPYLPVRQDGSLYPEESTIIVDAINDLLLDL
ncbi:MAG: phage virion morphogenesis protein [Gammaproteobacteria bacterium RIFCSPHIGHO2_12_FULL_63_22]|nr:MAG: phage virion morphogenesis protein [Gammaproteobacteria bacterium RIFCSPHIGHO2_12_FULL_63_22]